ncbi:MAG: glucuronate isomerase [Planctomycetia bacterium]|nr:glucuronate isomerase [Planctomycetia bacterium]
MTLELERRLLNELNQVRLIDPHSHINPHAAASKTLADILGYHYYTELAHSAGLARERIEEPGLDPKEKVARIVPSLRDIENTVQYNWLIGLCRAFFHFDGETITEANWEKLYDDALAVLSSPGWENRVLDQSGLDAIFLTNDFDDPLAGFDTSRYIPCLRTDDLVFHLTKSETRTRLAVATNVDVGSPADFERALGVLFGHFVAAGARACAISLPPEFEATPVGPATAGKLLTAIAKGTELGLDERNILAQYVFWKLAEKCAELRLPFDLMIGVNRRVYEAGVYQGQDLFDSRCSLIQYRRLFNAFPQVTFPISVLAHGMNQDLVSYSWIFPNVVTNGHWWYSNTPAYIELDCRTRLTAVPQTKQIGYYSDMYKLEFALPKFAMYRQVLARVLAQDFVVERNWSEDRALALGKLVLRGNVERVFPPRA